MKKYTITKAEILAMHPEECTRKTQLLTTPDGRLFELETHRLASCLVFVSAHKVNSKTAPVMAICTPIDPTETIRNNSFLTITD